MTKTKADFTHDPDCELGTDLERHDASPGHACQCAVREIGWVARESLAMMSEDVDLDSPRGQAYMTRKRALMAYIEATR